jgi:hypothetical protein
MTRAIARFAAAIACLLIQVSAFPLITKNEATLPDRPFQRTKVEARGPYPNPEIVVYGETVTTSPFNLTIELRPGAKAAKIKLNSLRVSYLKDPNVDLRPRIQPFIDSRGRIVVIKLEGAEAPPGKHQILLQVEDTNELLATKVLDLDIRVPR